MHIDSIYKVTIIIRAGNKMALIYVYLIDWLIDWFYIIHRSISTIAFDTDLVTKNRQIILHCILYMIREMEHRFLRRQFLTALCQKYWVVFYTK